MAMGEPGELQPCMVCILHLKSNGWRSTRSRVGGAHRGGEKVGMGPSRPLGPVLLGICCTPLVSFPSSPVEPWD